MVLSEPIDKLPPEILSNIFEECLPSIACSGVNRHWRDVALGCSNLWVDIHVRISEEDRLLDNSASRSFMVDLLDKEPLRHLSIGYKPPARVLESLEGDTHPMWMSEVLKPILTKVQLTTLRLDRVHILAELTKLPDGAFKSLQSLSLSRTKPQWLEDAKRDLLLQKLVALEDMPCLRTLALSRQALQYIGRNHANVPLPWSQLMRIEDLGLSWPLEVETSSEFECYISFLQHCLPKCANLKTLKLWADESDTEEQLRKLRDSDTMTVSTLSSLESLTLGQGPWRNDPVKSITLFNLFRFPNLKNLSIVAPRSETRSPYQMGDIHRHLRLFTKLEYLHLDIAHFGRDVTVAFLGAMPSVKTLSIRREFPVPGLWFSNEGCPIAVVDQNPTLLPQLETQIVNCDRGCPTFNHPRGKCVPTRADSVRWRGGSDIL